MQMFENKKMQELLKNIVNTRLHEQQQIGKGNE